MINTVPADTPVTMPDAEPTVAIALLPVAHTPPGVVSDKLIVPPTQVADAPVIGAIPDTVIVLDVAQPPTE